MMGTRSRIGVMHGDKCKSVYCHWDGYLDHNGRILLEHYDSAKANHLVALGDISSLDRTVEIPEGVEHTFENPVKGKSDLVRFDSYVGDEGPQNPRSERDYSIQVWQRYASPVWFDVQQQRVLQGF
jgi:hypothetical protein